MTTEQAPSELSDAQIQEIAHKDEFWFAHLPNAFCYTPFARAVIAADRALVASQAQPATPDPREPAPANSLPDWAECALRVGNSDFIAKRVAEGGYGPEPDTKLATELHRFIHEYDDSDPYRSAWFLHRLELVLKEAQAQPAAEPSVVRKALEAAQEVVNGVPQWHNAGYAASLIKQALKELDATAQQPAEPRQDSVHSVESSSPPTTKRGYLGSTVDGGIDDH